MSLVACLAVVARVGASEPPRGTVLVRVRGGGAAISSAEVSAGGLSAQTDSRGEARLSLPPGEHEIAVLHSGFAPATVAVVVLAGEVVTTTVQLSGLRFEEDVVVVAATRSGTIVEDQPLRVEGVPEEEIEENLTIAPGNLSTLLNELAGARLQATAPALGGARLRIRGMSGRHTTVLIDELPLGGQVPDAFGLLQVPPLDLAQVELIKGASSALYGASALGGILNLVSRRPGGEPEVLVNQTSREGTDAVGFGSGGLSGGWSYTLLGSAHRQRQKDLDGDGWADLAGFRRGVLRPRLFWEDDAGRSLLATVGAMVEEREGGTVGEGITPAGAPFRDALRTERLDSGVVARFRLPRGQLLCVHASLASTSHERRFGETLEHWERRSGFGELSITGTARGHTWVIGSAFEYDDLRVRDLSQLEYRYAVPALFAQDEWVLSDRTSLAVAARLDRHSSYGTFLSPRVSLLVRPGQRTSVRLSAGTGFAAPSPFTERTDAVGLSRLLPLHDLSPERAQSASFDIGWSAGALELNGTLFATRVKNGLLVQESPSWPGWLEIINAPEPTGIYGTEVLARYSRGVLHVIGTHTFVHASESEPDGSARREVPLTPHQVAELAVILEDEDKGRIGAELSYTGRQSLEDNPYRTVSRAYLELDVLGEVRVGEIRLFLNAVNLTDARQTRFDPLLLPERASDGRWTTEAWGPLEGRVFNLGVRMEF